MLVPTISRVIFCSLSVFQNKPPKLNFNQNFPDSMVTTENQQNRDIFLILDEVPCNIDSKHQNLIFGRPSGDWRGLKTNGIHLMMALKPLEEGNCRGIFSNLIDTFLSREKSVKLHLPKDLSHVQLNRVYRCTKEISQFNEKIIQCLNQSKWNFTPKINASSTSYISGHEVHGEIPEIIFVDKCSCICYCQTPVEHLMIPNKTNIFNILRRIQSKGCTEITVLIDTSFGSQNCVDWLMEELSQSRESNRTRALVCVSALQKCLKLLKFVL